MNFKNIKIGIIGLGYVGLPLCVEFGKKYSTVGYDKDQSRVKELNIGLDKNLDIKNKKFKISKNIILTNKISELKTCNFLIVSVPTPIDNNKMPDLTILKEVSKDIAKIIKHKDVVIFESTVYPGVTEEICVPIIEKYSNLKYINEDNKKIVKNNFFYCGYSPERINPGDTKRSISDIKKITSGSTTFIANIIDRLYKSIINAGTYKVPNIKVAEAAKVIENTQRDVNIALINELSIIFNLLNIDTEEVLKAAETKWNFNSFRPGLVGGHCIGVDPYYLSYKSQEVGYYPQMILSGRKINDEMSKHLCLQVLQKMSNNKISINNSKILIMGFTFKENCPDIRNSKSIDVYSELKKFNTHVDVYDPWVSKQECFKKHSIKLIKAPRKKYYDAIIFLVAHKIFKNTPIRTIKSYGKKRHIIYDAKYIFNKSSVDGRL